LILFNRILLEDAYPLQLPKGQVRGQTTERFNYQNLEILTVNTLLGDDYVASDDARAVTTINGGPGDDRFQVGQMFKSRRTADPDTANLSGEDVFGTIETTRGFLSAGTTSPMTINGGDGNDMVVVFHNKAVLMLNGGNGDDDFTIRAFALAGSQDNERARTDMKGDSGADTIRYVINAPVSVDGGDGFDTLIILGTEFADDFVVTDTGVFGAGLNVSYTNIEKLKVDGAGATTACSSSPPMLIPSPKSMAAWAATLSTQAAAHLKLRFR
jgi:hypothetical protein